MTKDQTEMRLSPSKPLELTPPLLRVDGIRRACDLYPTPGWVTTALLDHEWSMPPVGGSTILDPAAGDGAILRVCKARGYSVAAVELREECRDELWDLTSVYLMGDWLELVGEHPSSHTAVVCNPPYSLAFEFVQSCVPRFGYVAMLLRLAFLASLRRSAWNNAHPVTQLLPLARRPSFTGDGKADNSDYAWFIWERAATPRAPEVLL